jgi:hypothetical protein
MRAINRFLLDHGIRLADNPCISPDFCLDWPALAERMRTGNGIVEHEPSRCAITGGTLLLAEDPVTGDCAWLADGTGAGRLADGIDLAGGRRAYPATWENLLTIKNLLQSYDPGSTVFPGATGPLAHASLGIGARFTTLHWPAVDWCMAQLGLPLTANQNSIPRELVYDVEVMLAGRLDTVPFPFIGGEVPEGHQGQSVEGMSHGAVLAKLKYGFHRHRLPWGFNADHQPVGGKYDAREDALVRGCLLATYITFDLSPELLATQVPTDPASRHALVTATIPPALVAAVRQRVARAGLTPDDDAFTELLVRVWPAMRKMQIRDGKYAAARTAAFTTDAGRRYFRELSIDELPGLTTPVTLATMLALAEALGMTIHFVAPAFGFQKNFPFADQAELQRRVGAAAAVAADFGVSLGFHSGSGKSADNYRLCGHLTGGRLEIKTSGRYTYEMGAALAESPDAADRRLWQDWYSFTRELAVRCAFGGTQAERELARGFIAHALARDGRPTEVFADRATCTAALAALTPSPDHMFWFEYNFLFVLAAGGRSDPTALGDHAAAGYAQRRRFYAISTAGRLAYARRVARYICFLAETTGLADAGRVAAARTRLDGYRDLAAFLADIEP